MSIKILTPEEMRLADKLTVEKIGISSTTLMENAGKCLAEEVIKRLGNKIFKSKIAVLCGKGNNGGDGFVAARYLAEKVQEIKVFIFPREEEYTGDALLALRKLKEKGVAPLPIETFLSGSSWNFDVYIDAIFGTGFKGSLQGPFLDAINFVNSQKGLKVACDIPSGVNGESGEVENSAFKADLTCTFAFPKTGLLLYPGKFYAGEIVICDIGIPDDVVDTNLYLLTKNDVKEALPPYIGNEHKGSCGKILIIAGTKNYTGAAYLAAEASVNSGAGLTYLLVPEEIRPIMQSKLNEVIVLSYSNLQEFQDALRGDFDALVFGPGLGRTNFTIEALKLVLELQIPKVIDADGIWALSQLGVIKLANTILTPHPGEAAFLLKDVNAKMIDKNRIKYSEVLANQFSSTIVLKGAPTIISDGTTTYVNPTGNPGMAVGGMGDVLSGIIGALLPRTKPALKAAYTGVFIHGLSADLLLDEETFETITPTKVIKNLGKAFKSLR